MRWYMRVQAYLLLLTDAYPPFSFDDEPGYPVRIVVPPRERLNRLAVLFRFILVIPAYLLTSFVAAGGTTIVLFIAWLITLDYRAAPCRAAPGVHGGPPVRGTHLLLLLPAHPDLPERALR